MSDGDLLEYIYSKPNIKIQTKRVIPAQIRNHERGLTPFLSGDRFIYNIRGDFRRVLPSTIIFNHQKVRVLHHSQDLACSRCRYLGHNAKNIESCDAYWEDPNEMTIRSAQIPLCNYYLSDVQVYGQRFRSSEHAFQ